jgi:hypothetical protein
MLGQNSPETLKHKAQDLIQRLGYPDPPGDTAFGYKGDSSFRSWMVNNVPDGNRWNLFLKAHPSARYFWYRQSPRYLKSELFDNFGWVTESDPPYTSASGLITVNLDPDGRLTWLIAVPPQVDTPVEGPSTPDWSPLFAAAGLDPLPLRPLNRPGLH